MSAEEIQSVIEHLIVASERKGYEYSVEMLQATAVILRKEADCLSDVTAFDESALVRPSDMH